MSSEESKDWSRLEEVFEAALAIAGEAEREAFLERELGGQPELVKRARGMLRGHERPPLGIERRLIRDEGSLAGRVIGAYRLERLLGRGGMGEVYLAERSEPQFRQQVALKLLRAGWDGAEAVARFRQERQILARLTHPLIVPLLDGGMTEDGRPYLVLQYVEGRPITEHCQGNGIGLGKRLGLFCEVARAVHYAHRNLVVHRDLKPANILVTEEGQIRLLDFGIAKLLEPEIGEGRQPATRTDLRVMTPEYASPEQVLGGEITTATDIHALGVLLYELLAGKRPFVSRGASPVDLERQITERDPEPPSRAAGPEAAREVRGDLDAIVLKAMRKEPETRYGSAEEMARDVERYLAGETVQARAPGFGYRLGKLVRRNRAVSALTAACVVLLAGFAVTAFVQSRRIAKERDLVYAEQQKAERVADLLVEMLKAGNPMNQAEGKEVTVGELLRRMERTVVEGHGLSTPVQGRLKHVLGASYLARSEFGKARGMLDEALRQTVGAYGEEAAATAAVRHDLALLAAVSGKGQEAIASLRASLERHERLFGGQHEKVAACLLDLAVNLPAAEESLALLERALKIQQGISAGPSQPMALILAALGRHEALASNLDQAEKYLEDSIAMLEQLHPEGHPEGLSASSNLATVYAMQGRYGKATELNEQLIEVKSRLMGGESMQVALGWLNLGTTLANEGKHEKAEAAFREALARLVKLLGENHAQVANATRNVGAILYLRERYREAHALMERAARIQRSRGTDELVLWGMEGQTGAVMIRAGHREAGLRRIREAISKLKELRPGGHLMIAERQAQLGFALLEGGEAAEAEGLFREALELRRAKLRSKHPQVAEAECGMGWALAARGKTQEGRKMMGECLPGFRAWGLAHPAVVRRVERELRPPSP